jgi:hypothetical protein
MPTIRVDDEVYTWLQGQARPFEDSPNTVLRRVAGLDPAAVGTGVSADNGDPKRDDLTLRGERVTGDRLAKRWNVKVAHALYHRDGTFFENLQRFPGALFDPFGYVLFETAGDYEKSPFLRIGEKLNVPNGIASIPGYRRMQSRPPVRLDQLHYMTDDEIRRLQATYPLITSPADDPSNTWREAIFAEGKRRGLW